MDSNSNSSDNYFPKLEIDSENEKETSFKRMLKFNWTSENTMKLIETMEKDCKELWDIKNPVYRNRIAKQRKLEFLADMFGTTSEEISRKIHNLRTQFNNELRKIKRRQLSTGEGTVVGGSSWEYFDALTFLLREPFCDPLDGADGVNMELAEFQVDDEEDVGIAARAQAARVNRVKPKPAMRVAASAPLPVLPTAHPHVLPEEHPSIRPGFNPDECQIFGNFVASELRGFRSNQSRKKLKRMIQKAILKVAEEDDVNIHG
ncbi:hypothetical protein K1T71_003797 [Dendrolimus kikuchii]|uniref:Uncharacterized protein n=1 Tax=Dendrolimus kikuchii TaxID=765133 RepID=A0ACC1D8Z7_9NEOP|nr:hypothetical protein K1T71_003797 [Dendrolimus kikuchii]